ncbi:MAG: hypothetical protein IPG83_17710 [Novosphingobium sp.]|nr:hypothetical protein [Novosphingobium sp.]
MNDLGDHRPPAAAAFQAVRLRARAELTLFADDWRVRFLRIPAAPGVGQPSNARRGF